MYFYKILNNKSEKANRIIMNLPFSSYKFFKNALKMMANICIIHYYEIIEEKEINNRIYQLGQIAKKENVSIEKVKINKVKTYSPREFYICFDITAKRNMPM
jgi:tRNA (guanine37-N1)-methyltransferase